MRKKKRKRRSGKIDIFISMYMMIFLLILLGVQLQVGIFMAASTFMEDALVASNLASAVIDVREYGMTGILKISSPDEAYDLYKEALRQNLFLDDNWESRRKSLIYGQVEILKYEIYNVEKNDITIYSYGAEGEGIKVIPGGLGDVCTPNGILVESTSVYSKIGFPVKGILGVEIDARKDKTVDIVSDLSKETGGD